MSEDIKEVVNFVNRLRKDEDKIIANTLINLLSNAVVHGIRFGKGEDGRLVVDVLPQEAAVSSSKPETVVEKYVPTKIKKDVPHILVGATFVGNHTVVDNTPLEGVWTSEWSSTKTDTHVTHMFGIKRDLEGSTKTYRAIFLRGEQPGELGHVFHTMGTNGTAYHATTMAGGILVSRVDGKRIDLSNGAYIRNTFTVPLKD